MSSVATAQRAPAATQHEQHRQPFFLFRWLDAPWFPWVWMALWSAVQMGHALVSWHFVATGAALLRSDQAGAGLHLYAAHPELQIGPLTFLVAAPLNALSASLSGSVAAVAMAVAGPLMLLSLSRLPDLSVTHRQRGLAAAVLMPLWAELAVHYTHLDDALALVMLMAGLHALARARPIPAALLLAASADAKPWALAFVPLLLVLSRDRWVRAVLVWVASVVAAWLPFVLADPRTLHAGGFSIPNVASSSLRALGVTAAATPTWDRPVQLLLGVVLGAVAVRRGRWLVVPAVVLAARMLLDPGAYPYYTAGLVLATVLVDVGWRRTRWPLVSMAVMVGLYIVRCLGPLTPTNEVLGWLRAATLLGVLALALGPEVTLGSYHGRGQLLRPSWVRVLVAQGLAATPASGPGAPATRRRNDTVHAAEPPDLVTVWRP